ncbi:MAG: hypothetical protein N3D71_13140, partial [Burkholderiaceae bacterium]|nr:hypothetical protein [Burkholderiaceae bacterium]
FYEAVFTALGAEARWWPVDAAMARARFPERDCGVLDAHRLAQRRGVDDLPAAGDARGDRISYGSFHRAGGPG